MYLGPLLISGAWLLAVVAFRRRIFVVLTLVALMIGATAFYVPIARRESGAWAEVYRQDRATLRNVELFAAAHNCGRVVVTTYPRWRLDPNPYALPYPHAESRSSAFQLAWTWSGLVRRFSSLMPAEDAGSLDLAAEACKPCRDQPGFHFRALDGAGIVVVCPP